MRREQDRSQVPGDLNVETKFCPHPIGGIWNGDDVFYVGCGKWTCPHCGAVKKMRLAHRVAQGFFDDEKIYAWTLTQKLGSTQDILINFSKLRKNLKYYFEHIKNNNIQSFKLKYFWVKEFTKKGQRHLHILTNIYIDIKLLSKMWKKVTHGESYRVWINQANIRNAPGYMFKYLTKAFDDKNHHFNKKERRYGFSQDKIFNFIEILPILGNYWDWIAYDRTKISHGKFFLEIIYPEIGTKRNEDENVKNRMHTLLNRLYPLRMVQGHDMGDLNAS